MPIKIIVEYDGSAYGGWQIQPNSPSIQGELEKALGRLAGAAVRVRGAGRTDAGVHARGQTAVFSFPEGIDIPLDRLARAINTRLPPDIAVVRAEEVSASFDPRRDCVLKQYSYSFLHGHIRSAPDRGRRWHVKWPLDVGAMREAAGEFLGTHDFTSFCNRELADRENVRTIERSEILVHPPDPAGRPRLTYVVEGKSFLYNMVRALAGNLVDAGRGRFSRTRLREILSARDRALAGQSAPPQGLCMEWVLYPGETRPPDRNFCE